MILEPLPCSPPFRECFEAKFSTPVFLFLLFPSLFILPLSIPLLSSREKRGRKETRKKAQKNFKKSMEETNGSGGGGGDFEKLPEDCISNVISLTSPRDSCRSSLISTTFRSAAASDAVWDRFLPADYSDILARTVDPVVFESKRDLYFRLCDPVLIDGGKMSVALEKSSGRKCYMLSARELRIVWGDTPHYWRWISLPESRFSEVAELLNVCWLEIHGKIDSRLLSPKTTYTAYLIFKLVEGTIHFRFPPQEASVKVGPHESKHQVCLEPDNVAMQGGSRIFRRFQSLPRMMHFPAQRRAMEETKGDVRAPHARHDGWSEIEMGNFFCDDGEEGDVDMYFMEVKGGHWKSGLIVQGIEIRPKK